MKKLGERNYLILSNEIKICGTFDPREVLIGCEETLKCSEIEEIHKFLQWVHSNGMSFGRKNYEEVFAEFKKLGG